MRFVPSVMSYGNGATYSVDIKDVQGTAFRVSDDGVIELVSSGKTFSPGTAQYNTMVKNLCDVSGNRSKLEDVLGASTVASILSQAKPAAPAAPKPSGVTKPSVSSDKGVWIEDKVAADPWALPEGWWVWPAIIGTISSVTVVGLLYVRGTKSGEKNWNKAKRAAEGEARKLTAKVKQL